MPLRAGLAVSVLVHLILFAWIVPFAEGPTGGGVQGQGAEAGGMRLLFLPPSPPFPSSPPDPPAGGGLVPFDASRDAPRPAAPHDPPPEQDAGATAGGASDADTPRAEEGADARPHAGGSATGSVGERAGGSAAERFRRGLILPPGLSATDPAAAGRLTGRAGVAAARERIGAVRDSIATAGAREWDVSVAGVRLFGLTFGVELSGLAWTSWLEEWKAQDRRDGLDERAERMREAAEAARRRERSERRSGGGGCASC